jgi:hypothetical protein
MTPAQLATLESLPAQFAAIWRKLGGVYAAYNEQSLHDFALQSGILYTRRTSFDQYTPMEARKAISFFFDLKSQHQVAWTEKWMKEKAEREARDAEDMDIVASCMTYDQATTWVDENKPYCKFPEVIELVKTIRGITYYRVREKRIHLFTRSEVEAEFHTFIGHENLTLHDYFEPGRYPGWDGTLYKMLGEL